MLSFLLANSSYVSLGALVLSVFFAGTMLQGERLRTREVRDALREIENITGQSLERVAQINAHLEAEDARLVGQISQAYAELAALNEQERLKRVQIEQTARRRRQLENERLQERERIRSSTGFIFGEN